MSFIVQYICHAEHLRVACWIGRYRNVLLLMWHFNNVLVYADSAAAIKHTDSCVAFEQSVSIQ